MAKSPWLREAKPLYRSRVAPIIREYQLPLDQTARFQGLLRPAPRAHSL